NPSHGSEAEALQDVEAPKADGCNEIEAASTCTKSILEEKACPKPHPNVESLKRALLKAWDEIDVETLAKIVDNFPK
uniref:Uncharacterized protein n=1 Tax=Acrobeloides nanus TaxID=290746 RepID=A0A914DCK4_9BILA